MTPLERQQAFYKELKELLVKHKAEILIERETKGYSEDHYISVDFDYDESMFEEHGTGLIPSLKLGTYENGK